MTSFYIADKLPPEVDVPSIAEEALQAAFGVIARRLEAVGYPVSGDFAPGEALALDRDFAMYVRAMAQNNPAIAAMAEEAERAEGLANRAKLGLAPLAEQEADALNRHEGVRQIRGHGVDE